MLNKRAKTIACTYFIGGYEYSVTGRVYDYTSVKVSFSADSPDSRGWSDSDVDEVILSRNEKYVKTKEELDKYASWFYHPQGTSTSAQSLVSDDFSDSPVVDFSDSMSDSTEEFSSDQPESAQSDLEISEVEGGSTDVDFCDTSSDPSKQATE